MKEYETEAIKSGLGPQLTVALQQLDELFLDVTRNLQRARIQGLGGYHKIFMEDAVAAGVPYFITEYEPWLQLDRNRHICPNLRIVRARPVCKSCRKK